MFLVGTIDSVVATLFLWGVGMLDKFYLFNIIIIVINLLLMMVSLSLLIESKGWKKCEVLPILTIHFCYYVCVNKILQNGE